MNIIDDNFIEENETIELTLLNPQNALLGNNSYHTLTIIDNDSNDSIENNFIRRSGSGRRKSINIPNIIPPRGGFRIIINDNKSKFTNNKIVNLTLIGGPDTYGVLIANSPDFENKRNYKNIRYKRKNLKIKWNLCFNNNLTSSCPKNNTKIYYLC